MIMLQLYISIRKTLQRVAQTHCIPLAVDLASPESTRPGAVGDSPPKDTHTAQHRSVKEKRTTHGSHCIPRELKLILAPSGDWQKKGGVRFDKRNPLIAKRRVMLNVLGISRYHGYNCALIPRWCLARACDLRTCCVMMQRSWAAPCSQTPAPAHATCGCSVLVRPSAAKHQPQHRLRDDAAFLCGPVQSNTSLRTCCVMMQRSWAAPCSQTPAPAHAACGCSVRVRSRARAAKHQPQRLSTCCV